jgi:hypothetical protein
MIGNGFYVAGTKAQVEYITNEKKGGLKLASRAISQPPSKHEGTVLAVLVILWPAGYRVLRTFA